MKKRYSLWDWDQKALELFPNKYYKFSTRLRSHLTNVLEHTHFFVHFHMLCLGQTIRFNAQI